MNFEASLAHLDGVGESLPLGDHKPSYPDFDLDEYGIRYARLASLMELVGVEALVLTQEEPIKYLSGYNSVIWAVGKWLPGAMIATRDPKDAVLLPSAFDLGAAGGTSWVSNVDGHAGGHDLVQKVDGHLTRLGVDRNKLALERGDGSIMMLPFDVASDLRELAGDEAHDASPIISTLRMQKSAAEVERVRNIVRATALGYASALETAHIGMTEKQLVSNVASKLYASGGTAGTRPLFLNAVAGADRYPLVDTPASDRPLRDGDILFLDGGAGGDGYMSDIIRLAAFGNVTAEVENFAAVALSANEAMVASAAPGVAVADLFQSGQDVYVEAGLGQFGGSISGHGIGLELWERPFIKLHEDENENIRLRPGMVVCLEPILAPVNDSGELAGIFVFEQQVLISSEGCEVLSSDVEAKLWRVR